MKAVSRTFRLQTSFRLPQLPLGFMQGFLPQEQIQRLFNGLGFNGQPAFDEFLGKYSA